MVVDKLVQGQYACFVRPRSQPITYILRNKAFDEVCQLVNLLGRFGASRFPSLGDDGKKGKRHKKNSSIAARHELVACKIKRTRDQNPRLFSVSTTRSASCSVEKFMPCSSTPSSASNAARNTSPSRCRSFTRR